jgi:hypothetical protein
MKYRKRIGNQTIKTRNYKNEERRNQGHACQRHTCQRHACQRQPYQHHEGGSKRGIGEQVKNQLKQNGPALVKASLVIGCVLATSIASSILGVEVEDLKAPVKDLKDTIFGGWMWVPKIGAAVGGCLLAVYNQSIMPLATGAGVGLGIHFYDLYIKADGALI